MAHLRKQVDVQKRTQGLTHPGLTIAVYRVSTEGERTTVHPKRDVPAGNIPDTSLWPLCACQRCRSGKAVR